MSTSRKIKSTKLKRQSRQPLPEEHYTMVKNEEPSVPIRADPLPDSSTLNNLQSAKQRNVLDTVDKLRTCGLDNELSLPQIVVCGDQSAGKSSVLEALTELTLPRADELCTRFATEIMLRRALSEHITIRIIPDTTRQPEEQKAIKEFSETVSDFTHLTQELTSIIDKAKIAMGIGDSVGAASSRTFARDVLSIEIAGPGRPQLTVVDLPGMIQNENSAGDKALVDDLTRQYISQPRTICLAVITAMNDADNQRILTLVHEADPESNRSLGIVTKPDTLPPGSGSERSFIELASNKNKKYFFKLGWHVLKNRNFEETNVSFEKRNEIEAEFFRKSNFKEVPGDSVGIEALRKRLSSVLFDHIKRELPAMRNEVERMLKATQQKLMTFGSSRTTAEECREYLMDLSEQMQDTGKKAMDGNYEGDFFATHLAQTFDATSKESFRPLRALVHQMNEGFAQDMTKYGHTFHIGPEPSQSNAKAKAFVSDAELDILGETSDKPIKISYAVALTWTQKMICRNRGRELQGNYNPLVISELYRFQTKRWKSLAEDHVGAIASICSNFVYDVLSESCSGDVRDNLWTQYLEETLRMRESEAYQTLEKIIRSYRDHPINHNHYYTDTIRKIRQNREQERVDQAFDEATIEETQLQAQSNMYESVAKTDRKQVAQALSLATEADMLRFGCEEALDCTRSIYKVKQKVFVDVVLNLVVEDHILRDLEQVFSPKKVSRMTNEEVELLASEPEGIKRERLHYQDQLNRLQEGQKLLKSVLTGSGHV